MRLLVSVVDATEARAAVDGGADVIDVKNPAEGSLGAPSPEVVRRIRSSVPGHLPVSVALGDMPSLPGTAALAAAGAVASGATYVKVGLWGTSTEREAVALLQAIAGAVAGSPRVSVIAAAYADAERVPSRPLPPRLLVRVARSARVTGCLLDTALKDGRGLLEWLGPAELAGLVAEAHAAGLEMALAGGLRGEDLRVVRDAGADTAGVRSAVCRDGRRSAPLEAQRVLELRAALA
jgi:uncharacterized protein (UPF0264 family)